MHIYVKVQTKAKINSVIKLSDNSFKIKVTTAPEKGKANLKIIELLSEYFRIKKSAIILVAGRRVSEKIFNLNL